MLRPAFITAIIGTFILLILSNNLEPSLIRISEIKEKSLGSFVRIQGKIESISQKESLTIIKLSQENSSIDILAEKQDSFQKDAFIEVIGKVTEWHGILEIEASQIKTIENAP